MAVSKVTTKRARVCRLPEILRRSRAALPVALTALALLALPPARALAEEPVKGEVSVGTDGDVALAREQAKAIGDVFGGDSCNSVERQLALIVSLREE